jgi:acid phosphatase
MNQSFIRFVLAIVFVAGCRTATPPPAGAPAPAPGSDAATILKNQAFGATLWQQTSVEYRALAKQAYAAARVQLDAALADPQWTAALEQGPAYGSLPPAIVLDIDETILETTGYQAMLMRKGAAHSEELFTAYSNQAVSPAIEGAREFLTYAAGKGVKVFYVTNRGSAAEEGTRRNLIREGLPVATDVDTVIMRGERPEWQPGDKAPRRKSIAESYRIVLVFGDDFNDFASAYGKSVSERATIFEANRDKFGTKWIILPNPSYGTWERALLVGKTRPSPEEELEIKRGFLREDHP